MPRDLILFLDHAKQHVVDRIKEEHPEWVERDGVCGQCVEFYEKQISGEWRGANIGPREQKKRRRLGILMTVVSVGWGLLVLLSAWPRPLRLTLFVPIFLAVLCFLEERQKTCVVLAEFGTRNMDHGELKIDDGELAQALRKRGRGVIVKSLLGALLLTLLIFFFQ